jgi:hypothetical protein
MRYFNNISIPVVGTYTLSLIDSNGLAITCSQNLTVTSQNSIASFINHPSVVHTNTAVYTDVLFTQFDIINSIKYKVSGGSTLVDSGQISTSPTAVNEVVTPSLSGGLSTGNWVVEATDSFGVVMDSSVFSVTYTITSFTPIVCYAGGLMSGITATISSGSESISGSFAAAFILTSSPFTSYRLTATSISGAVISFSNLSAGLPAGTYSMIITDAYGNTTPSSGQTIVSVVPSISSYQTTPTVLHTNTAFISAVTLVYSDTLSSAALINQTSLASTALTGSPALPQTGTTIAFANYPSGLATGKYALAVTDAAGLTYNSPVFNVTYTIASFTPLIYTVSTSFAITTVLSVTGQTVSSAALVLTVSPFTSYPLTVSSSQPLSTTSCTFSSISVPVTGTYNLSITDPFGNNTIAGSTLSIINKSTITSYSNTPSVVNTGVAFTSSFTLSLSTVVNTLRYKNTSTLALVSSNSSPAVRLFFNF